MIALVVRIIGSICWLVGMVAMVVAFWGLTIGNPNNTFSIMMAGSFCLLLNGLTSEDSGLVWINVIVLAVTVISLVFVPELRGLL